MYLRFNRKKNLKAELAKKTTSRSCPSCSTTLEFVEGGSDRATYLCPKCQETVTFTSTPDLANKPPKRKAGSAITFRDKSGGRTRSREISQPIETSTNDELKMEQIRACMKDKYILTFAYDGHGTGYTSRTTEPYKLTLDKLGNVVLYAFDVDVGSIRIFKLNKMRALEKQEFTYSPRWDVEDKILGKTTDKEGS